MQLNTENNNSDNFTDKEKLEVQEMILNHRISEVIKELMKQSNIKTKQELGKKLGVSPAYISKVLMSDKYFNIPFLVKLQNFFGTTFEFNAKSIPATEEAFKPLKAEVIINSTSKSFHYNDDNNEKADAIILQLKFSPENSYNMEYSKAE